VNHGGKIINTRADLQKEGEHLGLKGNLILT